MAISSLRWYVTGASAFVTLKARRPTSSARPIGLELERIIPKNDPPIVTKEEGLLHTHLYVLIFLICCSQRGAQPL